MIPNYAVSFFLATLRLRRYSLTSWHVCRKLYVDVTDLAEPVGPAGLAGLVNISGGCFVSLIGLAGPSDIIWCDILNTDGHRNEFRLPRLKLL